MGWLWNNTHDIFDIDDGTYPEICLCGLSGQQVVFGYNLIRAKSRRLSGFPTFYSLEAMQTFGLDDIGNAAEIVVARHAKPFHFVASNIKFNRANLYDIGFFIFDNAICFDFKRSPLWGELEIETLLLLILAIKQESTEAFIHLGSWAKPDYRSRLDEALRKLASGEDD